MQQLTLTRDAPAKLNLRLKICGRRADGYHLLSMYNVLLDFADELSLALTDGETVSVRVDLEGAALERSSAQERELLSDPTRNIAARAVSALLTPRKIGAELIIKKVIPSGAGLGGGSSDAASALLLASELIYRLSGEQIAAATREAIALTLGADVPFFLCGQSALVSGIGEIVHPCALPSVSGAECCLIFPPFGCPTAQVYAAIRQALPDLPESPLQDPIAAQLRVGSIECERADLLVNDMQPYVFGEFPRLREIAAQFMGTQEHFICLTGSGSTLFALPRRGQLFCSEAREELARCAAQSGARLLITRIR